VDRAWEIASADALEAGDVIFNQEGLRKVACVKREDEGQVVALQFADGTRARYTPDSTFYRRRGE